MDRQPQGLQLRSIANSNAIGASLCMTCSMRWAVGLLCGVCWLIGSASGQEQLPNPFDLVPEAVVETAGAEVATTVAEIEEQDAPISEAPISEAPISEAPISDSQRVDLEQDCLQAIEGTEEARKRDGQDQPVSDEAVSNQPKGDEPKDDEPKDDELVKDVADRAADNEEVPVWVAPPDDVLQRKFEKAFVIEVEGAIFGRFHWYLNQRLDAAERAGADLVVIKLTSPGGDLEKSLQLARRLRDIDWATTIVYVPVEAISGGAIIALGSDRIYMKKGALIGDAGPIQMGLDGQFQHAEEKVVSFLASAVRDLAKSSGRPPAVAEAMVDRSTVLYTAVDRASGAPTLLTESETKAVDAKQMYKIGDAIAESGKNRFLTVDAERAKDLLLCEGVFVDEKDLFDSLNVERIERTQLTWVDSTVFLLNRPWLTVLLLVVGLIGLYLEIAAPGISVAGLVALLSFGIFFWSHALGGTSGWLEVLLFVLGVVCLLCEVFVLPGFGVFGLTGLALVGLSLVMASQDFVVPTDSEQWGVLQRNLVMVLGVLLGVILLGFMQVVLLDSLPGFNRFRLAAPGETEIPPDGRAGSLVASSAVQTVPIAIGAPGIADSDLRPSGKVMLDSRLVDVVTEGDYVDAGTPVEVIKIEGMRIVVRKKTT